MELEKVIILQFHVLHLFSMGCYPYTVQVHSWAGTDGQPKWRQICYVKYLEPYGWYLHIHHKFCLLN